jgi:Xaa-Pro aminopeptidase
MDRYAARRDKLRKALRKTEAEALLVTNFTNVTYLTGFNGDDSYLLVRPDGELMLTDGRYTTQLEEECPGLEVSARRPGVSMHEAVVKAVKRAQIGRLGIEAESMTVAQRDKLAEKLPKLELVATPGLVEDLREVKDRWEIERIREAVRVAEKAFAVVRATLRPEMTEKFVADELEHQIRLFGARCSSFPNIVAVGPRAALPHAVPGRYTLGESELLLIDWGADKGLYKSDLTRVLVTGKISPKFKRLYEIVIEAQTRAIAAIKPGVKAQDVDKVARRVIAKAGYGRRFGHGLGHGIGLDVHEAPRLAAKSTTLLKAGMVVTVEPGIYLPGWGGIRIEDDVLVTRDGHEVLTHVGKQLSEIMVR